MEAFAPLPAPSRLFGTCSHSKPDGEVPSHTQSSQGTLRSCRPDQGVIANASLASAGNYELRLDELDGIQPPAQERAEAQGLLPIGGATGTFCVPGDAVGRDWPVPATLTWIPWAVEANERPESVWPPTAGTNPAKKKLHLKRQSQPGAVLLCNDDLQSGIGTLQ
ncbi:unnamed protein product [Durusdinium trenchii]|uniref:Uncharacterized protein n=1 Tax=Durusdinium trenchii TaxID=1381693 RepID=A0ABP0K2J1_9DINO